ncbi:signal-regulatory protein beta-2-like [Pempheris klunzingeri]|uniref:signal-regulatory protein beta-2-like n=1 Tax=Pempheris klunzingeri TaxID=3127111 RepID=UPI00397FF188
MTPPAFALYVTCVLLGKMADVTAEQTSSSLRFISVSVGEDVTLECFFQNSLTVMLYWYKQTLGQELHLVSRFYKHDENGTLKGVYRNDPRFGLETAIGKNHLKISDARISDSATYYCISGFSYMVEFAGGTVLIVEGSGLNIPALVHQSASETIQPGGSETLNCTVHTGTCDGEHRVYWFRHSEESHPGLIYTHGGREDQCERKPEAQTHTCVYNLPMESVSLSHAGTYYCAVASCGYVVFGNGTKLDVEDEVDSLVYLLSGALAFTSILSVLLAYKAYTMYKTKSCKCTESQARPSVPHAGGDQDEDNLHYAAVRTNKANRSTRQRDPTPSECVYSGVKQ